MEVQGITYVERNKGEDLECRTAVLEMTSKGQLLKHELDSLISIPKKSHAPKLYLPYSQTDEYLKYHHRTFIQKQ